MQSKDSVCIRCKQKKSCKIIYLLEAEYVLCANCLTSLEETIMLFMTELETKQILKKLRERNPEPEYKFNRNTDTTDKCSIKACKNKRINGTDFCEKHRSI